jgi:signal transduction histidine kinase
LLECQEDERRRIAQELHDEVGQVLTAIKLTLGMLKKDYPGLDGSIQQELGDAIQLTDKAMEDVRRMSVRLRPAMLDNLGLKECLQQEIESVKQLSGLEIEFTWEDLDRRLTPQKEIVLYRVAQEAVTNLIKYAGVTKAEMSFRKKGGSIVLRIQDKGNGFDVSSLANSRGMGLLGMKERIDSVGGTLKISSRPGKGTVVEARVTY